jgi:hypothetical protein
VIDSDMQLDEMRMNAKREGAKNGEIIQASMPRTWRANEAICEQAHLLRDSMQPKRQMHSRRVRKRSGEFIQRCALSRRLSMASAKLEDGEVEGGEVSDDEA